MAEAKPDGNPLVPKNSEELELLDQERQMKLAHERGQLELTTEAGWGKLKLWTAGGIVTLGFAVAIASGVAIVASWFGSDPTISPEAVLTHILVGALGVLISDRLPLRPKQPDSDTKA